MSGQLPWRVAAHRALYGDGGFFRRPEGPAGHFRTSAHVSPLFAGALVRLARSAGLRTVVDMGAGRGELLVALHALAPDLGLHGVEIVGRPPGLPGAIGWSTRVPRGAGTLLVANEWLDDVPLDVVEMTDAGPRVLLVDPATGAETPGPAPGRDDLGWLRAWWPLEGQEVGARAEVGRPRDRAWAELVAGLTAGLGGAPGGSLLVAVDYAHSRAERAAGRFAAGTLTGYRAGRAVRPVPDGGCDLTAHVALDACAAAGEAAGARGTVLATQRAALRALGVAATAPPYRLARADPATYVAALGGAGEAAELLDRGGLGGFGWLVQAVGGCGVPALLRGIPDPHGD